MVDISGIVIGNQEAGVQDYHQVRHSNAIDDGVNLLAQPLGSLRILFRNELSQAASLELRSGPAQVAADSLVDELADRLAGQSCSSFQFSLCFLIQVSYGCVHVCIVTQVFDICQSGAWQPCGATHMRRIVVLTQESPRSPSRPGWACRMCGGSHCHRRLSTPTHLSPSAQCREKSIQDDISLAS